MRELLNLECANGVQKPEMRHQSRRCSRPNPRLKSRRTQSCESAALLGEAHEASAHRETICFSRSAAALAALRGAPAQEALRRGKVSPRGGTCVQA